MKKHKTISQSKLKCLFECERKYYWHYVKNIVSKSTPSYFTLGQAVHSGIQLLNTGAITDAILILKAYLDKDSPDYNLALSMIHNYNENNPIKRLNIKILNQEQSIERKITKDYYFKGKIDGLCTFNNKPYIIEYKTAKSVSQSYIEFYQNDIQLTAYCWLYNQPVGILLIILPKTKTGIITVHPFTRTHLQLTLFSKLLRNIVNKLESKHHKSHYLQNMCMCGGSFPTFFPCEYIPLCYAKSDCSDILRILFSKSKDGYKK